MDPSVVPVACTLTTKDASHQIVEWAELRSRAITVEPLADGVEMTFPEHLAAQVDDLAAREATCCAFLTIGRARTDGVVRLRITADDPSGVAVIDLIADTIRP